MELSVFALIISLTAVQSAIKTGPTNSLKKVVDHVELKCITDGTGCNQVDWQKAEGQQSPKPIYQSGRGMLNPEVFNTTRYSVSADDGCILKITGLMIQDSGRFICLQAKDGTEHSKSAVLVVISPTELCRSNVTNNELVQKDGYQLSCAINMPAKSLEPSEVTLSMEKDHNETVTMAYNWEATPPAVRTMLSSTAGSKNITERMCEASFLPVSKPGFDLTIPILKICSTEKLTVSFPVEGIAVSSSEPCKGEVVQCTASGYPNPAFRWNCSKSGEIVNGSELVIKGDAGEVCECTATNMVKGNRHSLNIKITVCTPCATVCVVLIVVFTIGGIVVCVVVVSFSCWKFEACPLFFWLHNFVDDKNKSGLRSGAEQPLNETRVNSEAFCPPKKPPRTSDTPDRPTSGVHYAELRPERNPRQMKSNPVNNSSTLYATVAAA